MAIGRGDQLQAVTVALAACAEREVRLIYASSAATYGDGTPGFEDDASPDALARLRPLNLYGWSKLAFDRRVADAAAARCGRPPQWAGLQVLQRLWPERVP